MFHCHSARSVPHHRTHISQDIRGLWAQFEAWVAHERDVAGKTVRTTLDSAKSGRSALRTTLIAANEARVTFPDISEVSTRRDHACEMEWIRQMRDSELGMEAVVDGWRRAAQTTLTLSGARDLEQYPRLSMNTPQQIKETSSPAVRRPVKRKPVPALDPYLIDAVKESAQAHAKSSGDILSNLSCSLSVMPCPERIQSGTDAASVSEHDELPPRAESVQDHRRDTRTESTFYSARSSLSGDEVMAGISMNLGRDDLELIGQEFCGRWGWTAEDVLRMSQQPNLRREKHDRAKRPVVVQGYKEQSGKLCMSS
ncbi:hypothetical protein EW146_g1575 [Bondarzewia mesenterica]|uniref:Uncharacterized protein n=1 Tax=Bondarzewia mesenterica TaxID=1095465 RepID=A0A4V3XG18_9AGAM|nr:hypothetical protein EW146_g1575 [Bondarzewia mesenterica]